MSWIRKSPFDPDEDPAKHMLELLSKEAERAGAPFSDEEQEILATRTIIPVELDIRARNLIEQMLERETVAGPDRDPKSFGNSLEWTDCDNGPNVVELTIAAPSNTMGIVAQGQDWARRLCFCGCDTHDAFRRCNKPLVRSQVNHGFSFTSASRRFEVFDFAAAAVSSPVQCLTTSHSSPRG